MKFNKAQLSIFMIVAVLLLFVLLFIFLFSTLTQNSDNPFSRQGTEKVFVESCLEKVSQNAIFLLGLQNGIKLANYLEINDYKINYAYEDNKSLYLTIGQIEDQLENYIDTNLPECISNYDNKSSRFIKADKIKTSVAINRLDVTIALSADIEFEKGNRIIAIKRLASKLPIRLSKIQKIIEYVSLNTPDKIELYDYLGEQDLNTTIYHIDNTSIYSLIDDKSRMAGKPYKYLFAIG